MSNSARWWLAAKLHPGVALLLLGSLFGAALASFAFPLARAIMFGGLADGQYWKLITPIFLHFGLMHLVFNGLWLALLGGRIERLYGSMHLLLLVFVSGAVSNLIQYSWQGSAYFGGMSGVVYALLGYIWIKSQLVSQPGLQLPPGILAFMLVWLLVGMTGVLELVLGIGVANGAHVGGLLIGMALGLVFGLMSADRGK
ncbi:MAG: rhomboid family intramembrane serine protease [Porticoccaceae bacterium]|jgi:GlpG protein